MMVRQAGCSPQTPPNQHAQLENSKNFNEVHIHYSFRLVLRRSLIFFSLVTQLSFEPRRLLHLLFLLLRSSPSRKHLNLKRNMLVECIESKKDKQATESNPLTKQDQGERTARPRPFLLPIISETFCHWCMLCTHPNQDVTQEQCCKVIPRLHFTRGNLRRRTQVAGTASAELAHINLIPYVGHPGLDMS